MIDVIAGIFLIALVYMLVNPGNDTSGIVTTVSDWLAGIIHLGVQG